MVLSTLPPTRASTIESFYLAHGHHANAFSVAFDEDLDRHVSTLGVLAHARCRWLDTSIVYYDPLSDDMPALLDEWLATQRSRHVGFWKVSRATAALLAERGFQLVAYGFEHNNIEVPPQLGGTAMRGLRRQVEKARGAGVVVSALAADTPADAPVWAELDSLNRRWLRTRTRSFQVRRISRRYAPHAVEPHTTRLCARDGTGRVVGWASLDHMHSGGALTGVGLSGVRWDPTVGGVASLLAVDGATLVARQMQQQQQQQQQQHQQQPPPPLTLSLGESPLAVRRAETRADWASSASSAATTTAEAAVAATAAAGRAVAWNGALERFFALLHRWGNALYNTRGIARWKAKWRAPRPDVSYVAVDATMPWRHVAAVLWLAVAAGERGSIGGGGGGGGGGCSNPLDVRAVPPSRGVVGRLRARLLRRRAPAPQAMAASGGDSEDGEASGGDGGGRLVRWRASVEVAEACDEAGCAGEAAFLDEVAGSDLIVRLDDSVVAVEPLVVVGSGDGAAAYDDDSGGGSGSSDGGTRYLATIAPVRFPGLTVAPVATIRVARVGPGALRYTTEEVANVFSGPFSGAVEKLQPTVTAFTELTADAAAGELRATAEFELALPLPRWWPIPDAAMAAGERLIQAIVAKDTQLTVARLKGEYAAWRPTPLSPER